MDRGVRVGADETAVRREQSPADAPRLVGEDVQPCSGGRQGKLGVSGLRPGAGESAQPVACLRPAVRRALVGERHDVAVGAAHHDELGIGIAGAKATHRPDQEPAAEVRITERPSDHPVHERRIVRRSRLSSNLNRPLPALDPLLPRTQEVCSREERLVTAQ